MDSGETWPDLILNFIIIIPFFFHLCFGPDQPFKSGIKSKRVKQNGTKQFSTLAFCIQVAGYMYMCLQSNK